MLIPPERAPVRADLPAAVLFDLDGTLVDTEPYWIAAEYALAERYGGSWSDADALKLIGSDLLDSGRYIRGRMGIDPSAEMIVEELVADVLSRVRREVPWRPGGRELLADLGSRGVPCALVTMSYRPLIEPILAALPPGTFAVTVTGDEVSRGKPHPEPYLRAARLLGVRPEDCVAVEDSETGTKSAVAAGCQVLVAALHTRVSAGPSRHLTDTLTGWTGDRLPTAGVR